MKLALGVEYDGAQFCGWQRQRGVRSVQAVVEDALTQVANHRVRTVCAGRTDRGVHATGQVVHAVVSSDRTVRSWLLGGNSNLPKDVVFRWVRPVADEFDARFSARARTYRYVILNRDVRSALLRDKVTWTHYPLATERMHQAGQCLVGEHDFSAFRTLACQARHPIRTIHALRVSRASHFVYLDVTANGFLHNMVRIIAGVLMAIGTEARGVEWAGELLSARDRTLGGVTAPPQGLYFIGPSYPESFNLPGIGSLPSF
jgi:tRNA pseudouridine38-40 synthase